MTDVILEVEWVREVHYRGDKSWMSPKLEPEEIDDIAARYPLVIFERRGGIYELVASEKVWWAKVANEQPMKYATIDINVNELLNRANAQGSAYSAEDFDDAIWIRKKGGTVERHGGHYVVVVPGLGTFVDVNLREIVSNIMDQMTQQAAGERGI